MRIVTRDLQAGKQIEKMFVSRPYSDEYWQGGVRGTAAAWEHKYA
jgi:hypothetical protein